VATAPGREVLLLVALVLALDALFVAIYFMGNVRSASDPTKVVFTPWAVENTECPPAQAAGLSPPLKAVTQPSSSDARA
jgi:hypothetical protein